MSHSQFTKARLEDNVEVQGRQVAKGIVARGPLQDVPLNKYVPPFVIHVTIIQNPPNKPKPEDALRASGYTTAEAEGEWVAEIDTKGAPFDRTKPARGVAVAVLGRTEGYTSEVLTWCDQLPDLDGTTMEEFLERQAQASAA